MPREKSSQGSRQPRRSFHFEFIITQVCTWWTWIFEGLYQYFSNKRWWFELILIIILDLFYTKWHVFVVLYTCPGSVVAHSLFLPEQGLSNLGEVGAPGLWSSFPFRLNTYGHLLKTVQPFFYLLFTLSLYLYIISAVKAAINKK